MIFHAYPPADSGGYDGFENDSGGNTVLSDNIKNGVERAPNRSLLYALGYTEEEISRPLVGVVSSYNEVVPGHMNIDNIA